MQTPTRTTIPTPSTGDQATPRCSPRQRPEAPHSALLSPRVLDVIGALHSAFEPRRRAVLQDRRELADRLRSGADLGPLPQTAGLRADGTWRVDPPPADLARRRVELAGPATAEQARLARSSGADTWVADLEDMLVPTWERLTHAHTAISGYVRHTGPAVPTLVVRPRGLHLSESHVLVDGVPVSATVVDTALFVARQAHALLSRGSAPYLYLPKLEHHHEAQWWDDLLGRLEDLLDLPRHTIRVSVLVETAPAAYQLEEILHALRHRVTALTAGRYDYVASHLYLYAERPDHLLPDLAALTMSTRFLRAYTDLVVQTCHRRGAQAIGGPVAEVPQGAADDAAHRAQARVRRDKAREATQGFDGAWVLHPALVPVAEQAFAVTARTGAARPSTVALDPGALGDVSALAGSATLAGLRTDLRVSLRYLTGWLGGAGTCEIDGHLEDFGTVELARLQVWQWAHHGVRLAEGPHVTDSLVRRVLEEEAATLRRRRPEAGGWVAQAARLLRESFAQRCPAAFLSPAAYAGLVGDGDPARQTSAPAA